MGDYTTVVIGIQARSTSKRFPRKVFETIDGRPMLQHVIDACDRSAKYMNNHTHKTKMIVQVALCIPYKDEIGPAFSRRAIVVEGPEDDVLSRYRMLADKLSADYVVRITGDCPLIPPYLITKHIRAALVNAYDYISNVDDGARTAPDGLDAEVMSRRMLDFLHEKAEPGPDREHVTLLARRDPPPWARIGHVVGHMDLSNVKVSVDTPDDLERVRAAYDQVKRAVTNAERLHGRNNTHRF